MNNELVNQLKEAISGTEPLLERISFLMSVVELELDEEVKREGKRRLNNAKRFAASGEESSAMFELEQLLRSIEL